jgi:hypothetical protein
MDIQISEAIVVDSEVSNGKRIERNIREQDFAFKEKKKSQWLQIECLSPTIFSVSLPVNDG